MPTKLEHDIGMSLLHFHVPKVVSVMRSTEEIVDKEMHSETDSQKVHGKNLTLLRRPRPIQSNATEENNLSALWQSLAKQNISDQRSIRECNRRSVVIEKNWHNKVGTCHGNTKLGAPCRNIGVVNPHGSKFWYC